MFYNLVKVFIVFNFVYAERIPIIIWSNLEKLEFTQSLSCKTLAKNDFLDKFINIIPEADLIVFISENIKINDILINGQIYSFENKESIFNNLKLQLATFNSFYIKNSVMSTKRFMKKEYNLGKFNKLDFNLSNLEDLNTKYNFIQSNLTSFIFNIIEKEDNMIERIMSMVINKNKKFIAFLIMSSYFTKFQLAKVKYGRHLLTSSSTEHKFEPLVISDLKGFKISFERINIDGILSNTNLKGSLNNSNCSSMNGQELIPLLKCLVSIKIDSVGSLTDVNILFFFQLSGEMRAGYYFLNRIKLNYIDNSTEISKEIDPYWFDPTPIGFSFYCCQAMSSQEAYSSNLTEENKIHTNLSFYNIQLQIFMRSNIFNFGPSNDCQGLFNTVIIMVLFCSLILIGILIFGIHIVLSINTMETFDDPKNNEIKLYLFKSQIFN